MERRVDAAHHRNGEGAELVAEVDDGLVVDGGDLVDAVGGDNLVQAIRRTGDVRHHDASRGRVVDDLEHFLGLGGGAGDVGDGRR